MFVKNDLGQWVPAHPDVVTHETMGLATQSDIDAHATNTTLHTHPDLTAHTTLGLVASTEMAAYLTEAEHTALAHAHTHDYVALAAGGIADRTQLGLGTPDATNFLRGDGTWATSTASPLTLPIAGMAAMAGTPALDAGTGSVAFDAAADELVVSVFTPPIGWATVHVDLVWVNLGAGTGNVQWDMYLQSLVSGAGLGVNLAGTVTAAAPAGTNNLHSRIMTGQAVTAGTPYRMRLYRTGTAVGDTLTNDAGAWALLFTRAS